ncbi:MAG: protease modulator HflC [Treponema sp.]|nr:protease modulator HflC [Treponema sp.]
MKKIFTTLIIIFVILISIMIAGPLFVINEGEQAVIVQLGKITKVVTEAGLHVKVPFIDEVVRYPKKIMTMDGTGPTRTMPTRERQQILVDITARWRIADPQKFYESVSDVPGAISRLSEIIDSEVRTVIAENPLIESVRNSNMILERSSGDDSLDLGDGEEDMVISATREMTEEPIVRGRRQLAGIILERSRRMAPEFGIELIDVVIRQISYSPEITSSVYERMKRERNQVAMRYRSIGEGRKAEWEGKMDREKDTILSAAYNESQTIMGNADAEAARIYTAAYNAPGRREFYQFWRAIESYRVTMPKFDKTLTTDMEYFRYLYSPR